MSSYFFKCLEKKFKVKKSSARKKKALPVLVWVVLVSSFFGFVAGALVSGYYYSEVKELLPRLGVENPEYSESSIYSPQTSQEEAIIKAVEEVSPAVVSIVVSKDVPIIEEYYIDPFGEGFGFMIPRYRQKGTEKKEVGGGSGFIVSEDGMIVTNKHVVLDDAAEYTVFTNDGQKFPAKVLAKDPFQDLAVIKVEEDGQPFPTVKLGDSSQLRIGQTVVAIGNALGEFKNTVSVGVISGLGRSITAAGDNFAEYIEDVIQTDAAINKGNSGGPLLSLKGEVVGINTATVLEAQSIGFAIPVNKAKRDIDQVKKEGKISYAFLGIYYTMITPELKEEYDLPVDNGAWVGRNREGQLTEGAILPDSAAEEIGLQRNDIILEFDNEEVSLENTLAEIILEYKPGEKVSLKILRDNEEIILEATLGENK